MNAQELIGKKAIRTGPVDYGPRVDPCTNVIVKENTYDFSMTTEPIFILAATENHIIYKYPEECCLGRLNPEKNHILKSRWCDDQWTDYDELMKLASPEAMSIIKQALGDQP